MKSTFKVLFYLKKGSEKKNGEVMIMARITIDGKLCQFSTKQSILPDSWNIVAGKAKGKDAGKINALLDDIKASLNNIYHEQQRRDNYVTAEKVKNEFLGHSEKHETILTLFKKHNDDVKQLVGISKTIATYRKYEVTRRHLAEFIQSKYNVSDFAINEITPMFITDFELYLRTTCKCGFNTTAKFMQFFKRIILIARNNGILIGDPFASYKIRLEKVDRGYLSEDEIKIILKKKMVSERLEQVRDVFIFSCFSGLAYVDVANLKQDNIRKSFDGNLWIITKRQKTNTDVNAILKNLLSNALKYTPRNGNVHVCAYTEQNTWSIEVSDTGIGIPAGERKYLGGRFFRGSNAVNQKVPGSGIGLMLVCKLVRLHKGRIIISSTEGEGTCVRVTFPMGNRHLRKARFITVAKTEDAAPPQPETCSVELRMETMKNGKSSSRILVVEDNDDLRGYIERLLGQDYHVQSAQTDATRWSWQGNITRT